MHLVDTTMFASPQGGGVERYLGAKHRWLAEKTRVRHTVVAPGVRNAAEADGIIRLASRIPCLNNGFRFPLALRPWCKQLVALDPDLIEAGDAFLPAWAALQAGNRLGVPVIGFYHSDLQRALSRRLGSWVEPVIARYMRLLYRQFDLVLAPSCHAQDRLEQLGVRDIRCQPLGVDPSQFNPGCRDESLRARLGLSPSTRLVVFAGRGAPEKNLPVLYQALELLGSEYHLLLVGTGLTYRPQHNVTVVPFENDAGALARLLASCDALVHAGDQETFGLVILEAMACGIPVVGVDRGAVRELVAAAGGVVVRAGSGTAMAEGIRALYDGDLAERGAVGRRMVLSSYSWDAVMRNLLAHYTRLVAAPVSPSSLLYVPN